MRGYIITVLTLIVMCAGFTARADDAYALMQRKATQYAEWGDLQQALGQYASMRALRPDSVRPYAAPMVINSVLDRPAAVMAVMDSALTAGIRPVPLFEACREQAVTLAHLDHYEKILRLADQDTRLTDVVQPLLLDYYSFRDNGEKMLALADKMLLAAPNEARLLEVRARAFICMQRDAEAIAAYQTLLTADPKNLDALLYIGNYYMQQGDPERGKPYLQQAYALRPSLYLQQILFPENNKKKPLNPISL